MFVTGGLAGDHDQAQGGGEGFISWRRGKGLRREERPEKRQLVWEGETEPWPAHSRPGRPAELAQSKVPRRHHLPQ